MLLNFSRCTLFECRYELKVTACISGCSTDLDIETDASVGHIPQPDQPETNHTLDQCGIEPPVINQPMPMPGGGYGFSVPLYPLPNATASFIPSAPTKADVFDTTSGGLKLLILLFKPSRTFLCL